MRAEHGIDLGRMRLEGRDDIRCTAVTRQLDLGRDPIRVRSLGAALPHSGSRRWCGCHAQMAKGALPEGRDDRHGRQLGFTSRIETEC
jgi:hypothetical protein